MSVLLRKILFYLLLFFIGISASSLEYFVSPNGQDTNTGTLEKPFKTISKASEVLRPGDSCYIREGVYREILRPKFSGEEGLEITYQNYKNEQVYITGTDILSGWVIGDDDIYYADMDWNLTDNNQVFFNGKMLTEASWPAAGNDPFINPDRAVVQSSNKGGMNSFINTDIPGNKSDWIGAKLWCAGGLQWISWTGEVTDFDSERGVVTYKTPGYDRSEYTAVKGSFFVLKGVKAALKAKGQWLYNTDNNKLEIIPPAYEDDIIIEAKRRMEVIDLRERSYIKVKGIDFYSGTIVTDSSSSFITLENINGNYMSHSYTEWDSETSGVQINGSNNLVLNCDFGYSSGPVLQVNGSDNRIINSYFHHGNYAGLWNGAVALSGRRQLFSHNTVKYSGRDLLTIHGLMESLIQYNDLSHAGFITKDLGIIYGHNTDFANTQIRNNWIHDNLSSHISMGIYFDHASANPIIYNNVIWNTKDDPVRFNNPVYNAQVFNNSAYKTGTTTTFGYFENRGMYMTRFYNNIFNDSFDLPGHVKLKNNSIARNPGYVDPEKYDFRLNVDDNENRGAYNTLNSWKPGCDLTNPPNPIPEFEKANVPWMNTVVNSGFEYGTLEGWSRTGRREAELITGNNWGNEWGTENIHKTGTNKFELQLSGESDGISQTISNLTPGTNYTLSGWLRTSDRNTKIAMAVKDFGGEEIVKIYAKDKWGRIVIKFTTGPDSYEATINIEIVKGVGKAWCDNLTLPLSAVQK